MLKGLIKESRKPIAKTQLESDIEDAQEKLDSICRITNEGAWEDALGELEVLEKKQADFEADL